MTKQLYKRGYLGFASLTAALLISGSTAMVFAAETATIAQEVVAESATDQANIENLGRFVVTPKSATFVSPSRNQK